MMMAAFASSDKTCCEADPTTIAATATNATNTVSASFLSSSIFLAHKPVDVVCSKEDEAKDVVVRGQKRLTRKTMYELADSYGFPGSSFNLVGRLDADTSGLILFTNKLRLLSAINHPVRATLDQKERERILPFKEKEYIAVLRPDKTILRNWKRANGDDGENCFDPIKLEADMSRPFGFDYKGEHFEVDQSKVTFIRRYSDAKYTYGRSDLMGWCIEIRVIIAEGKHHQIRRMTKRCGYKVGALTRIRIAGMLTIDSLPMEGSCRWLTKEEEQMLTSGLLLHSSFEQSSLSSLAVGEDLDCSDGLVLRQDSNADDE